MIFLSLKSTILLFLMGAGISASAGITNGDFSNGLNNWTIVGATSNPSDAIRLGTTVLAGCPSTDLSNYANMQNHTGTDEIPVSYFSRPSAQVLQSKIGVPTFPGSGHALELSFSGTASSYGVVHAPAAVSDPFTARAGEVLTFDWFPLNAADDFAIVAYLQKTDCSGIIEVISATGSTIANMLPAATGTGWQKSSVTIPSDGSYQFVFVNGSFDRTGGTVLGSYMYVTNIYQGPDPATATVSSIPTLSDWAMIWMAGLIAMLGIRRMRRSK